MKAKPSPRPAHPSSPQTSAPASAAVAGDFVPSPLTGWLGFCGFLLGVLALNRLGPVFLLPRYWEGFILMAFCAVPMIACDALILGARKRRGPAGAAAASGRGHSLGRTATKLAGLAVTVGLLGLVYWILPEYHPSLTPEQGFYNNFFLLCRKTGLWAALAAALYFWVQDARMDAPRDGYWHFGRVVLLRFDGVDRKAVNNHLRTWAVKGFFMPLMFALLCNNLPALHYRGWPDLMVAHDYIHNLLFTVDLAFVSCGYLLTLRCVDSHVRSAEPTALGWMAALMCYQPLWTMIGDLYLGYWGNTSWDKWLDHDSPLFAAWGAAILFFEGIFVWASLSFGLRFSNLTHRGIVRFGPYYFTKHPAYLSKLVAFFLISVPCLDSRGPGQQLRNCLMLGGLALVYRVRAVTEERHLSGVDSSYAVYAEEVRLRHRRWLRLQFANPKAPHPDAP